MPDNDYLPSRVSGVWRGPATMAAAQRPSVEVGEEIGRVVVKAVRDCELPRADDLSRALRDAELFGNWAAWDRAKQQYLFDANRSDAAFKLLGEAEAMVELLGEELRTMSDAEVGRLLVGGGLRRWAEGRIWGAQDSLASFIGAVENGVEAAWLYRNDCLAQAPWDELASRLLARPGSELRAPVSASGRAGMPELLDEEVD